METTVKQRLERYLSFRRVSKSEFGRAVGVSNAYVASIKQSISPEKIKAIGLNYPDLNIEWLLTGEGQMLNLGYVSSGVVINGDNQNSVINNDQRQYYSDSPDVLRAHIQILDERIKEKDAQIKEKDAQIRLLLDIIKGKSSGS